MSFWNDLNPGGNNFFGLGPTAGRTIAGLLSSGGSETIRPGPFGLAPKTALAGGIGGSSSGAASGAGTGMLIGGPYGAIAGGILGGIGGGVAGTMGKTHNYKPMGFLENTGIGVGGGLVGGEGAAALGGSGAGSAAGGAGAADTGTMVPYMPTSTPVMGQAGSTLGGGMGSSLNLTPSAMGSTGAAPGAAATTTGSNSSLVSRLLQLQRGQGQGTQAPASQQANILAQIYKMLPGLRPGQQMNSGAQVGGTNFGS